MLKVIPDMLSMKTCVSRQKKKKKKVKKKKLTEESSFLYQR